MKTKEELNAIKEEVEALNKKLAELSDEEMAYVSGGSQNEDRGLWGDGPKISGLNDEDSNHWPGWRELVP